MNSNKGNNTKLYDKMAQATKWNAFSEMVAKLFVPISNMILARILLPSEFGVVATVMMIITLIDLVAESGFQKYLIKTSFESNRMYVDYLNVAFTINLSISILSIIAVLLFNTALTSFLGSKELYYLLLISMSLLIFSSFKIIQVTVYRKKLEYKVLGIVRVISVIIPLVVTLPLAFLGFSYWSIILGKIVSDFISLIMLQKNSNWKPRIKYSRKISKDMLSTSSWAFFETILQWGTTYLGVLYLMVYFSSYYVGIYRTAMVSTDGILVTFYMPILSVMYSSLSLTDTDYDRERIFNLFHKLIAIILIPASTGLFLFKEMTSKILLGSGWEEAPFFIGFWAISTAAYVLYGVAFYELYRSKGLFHAPVIIHGTYFLSYVLTLFFVKPTDFDNFVILNVFMRIVILPLLNYIFYFIFFKKSVISIMSKEKIFYISTVIFGMITIFFFPNRAEQGLIINFLQIGICIVVYVLLISLSRDNRSMMVNLLKRKNKFVKKEKE